MTVTDPAFAAVTTVMNVMREVFGPDGAGQPPVGGGVDRVHFVTGEGAQWDPLIGRDEYGDSCDPAFVWVRQVSRYRTVAFPEPTSVNPCGGMTVLALELGVGRCVNIDPLPNYEAIAKEAEWGLDDSFRLNLVACILGGEDGLGSDVQLAVDPIMPEGPEGGGVVWTTTVYIGFLV